MAPTPPPRWLVLENCTAVVDGQTIRFKQGDIIREPEDATPSGNPLVPPDVGALGQLSRAGFALVRMTSQMDEPVTRFLARPKRSGEPEGSLMAVLLSLRLLPPNPPA